MSPPAARTRRRKSVSKRHQSSRRKTYGRRQHELRERVDRHGAPEPTEFGYDDDRASGSSDAFAHVDQRMTRLRFGYGD